MHNPLSSLVTRALLALTVSIAATGVAPATQTPSEAYEGDRLRLAWALAVHPDQLTALTRDRERLADGRIIDSFKAYDLVGNRPVGASFIDDRPVDLEVVRHEANAQWRFDHGAKTAALLERLATLRMDDRLTVDLWFAFEQPDDGGGPSGGLEQVLLFGEAETATLPAGVVMDDGNPALLPLAPADADRVQRQAAAWPVPASADPAIPASKAPTDEVDPEWLIERKAQAIVAIEQVEEHNQARIATLQAALAPASTAMRHKLEDAGLQVIYASTMVPSIIAEGTRQQIETVARWHDMALIDPILDNPAPGLSVARAAHNAVPLNAVGLDGTGVTVAVVEGGRVFRNNPFMTVAQTRLPNLEPDDESHDEHATSVAGIIASRHNPHRGMASAATLISANARYSGTGVNSLAAATDWAAERAHVLNHSWYSLRQTNSDFNAFDRRLDHITRNAFRTNVNIAGNEGAHHCQNNGTTTYGVASPGRGYNVLTVGGYDDRGTVAWPDDLRYNCSSNGWPTGDGAGGAHQKPEIAASGVNITSLTRSTNPASATANAGSGTSFAAPGVAGVAAALMETDAQLAQSPVSVRALMLVGALHAPAETRAMSATASTFATEVGPWWFQGANGDSFPITYNVQVRAGQRVRFAIAWLSNVTLADGSYSNDRLPADLDLRVFRSNGNMIASSASSHNPFEIVDFYAPVTDTYRFVVNRYSAVWTGGATPFAAAARIDGYLMPRGSWWASNNAPPTMGMFFDVRPDIEYSGAMNQWRGVGMRPASGDYDLQLYANSWFIGPVNNTDTFGRPLRASSTISGNGVDFILVDGNHWGTSVREHYRVNRYSGSGAYTVSAANLFKLDQDTEGTYGPFSLGSSHPLFVVDVGYRPRSLRRFTLIPATGSSSANLAMAIFTSQPGNSATWARGRQDASAQADHQGPGGIERMRYRFPGASADRLGLAIYNQTHNTNAQFYLKVTPSSLFSDGFNGD